MCNVWIVVDADKTQVFWSEDPAVEAIGDNPGLGEEGHKKLYVGQVDRSVYIDGTRYTVSY